jgi:hypothetical protein
VQPGVVEETAKVASTAASSERKKKETPLLAWASVRLVGSMGSFDASPGTVELNVRVLSSTRTVELMVWSVTGRSGVL